ncbi:hypothetical protein Cus16_1049 [Curtobacterium sp. ER1/6]|nr:hypothetical protein Cus16_1049 [Curtobacterium sp. ER1/6]
MSLLVVHVVVGRRERRRHSDVEVATAEVAEPAAEVASAVAPARALEPAAVGCARVAGATVGRATVTGVGTSVLRTAVARSVGTAVERSGVGQERAHERRPDDVAGDRTEDRRTDHATERRTAAALARHAAAHAAAVHAAERALHEAGLPDLGPGRRLGERPGVVAARGFAVGSAPGELVVDHPALLGRQGRERLGVDLLDALGRGRAEQVAVPLDGALVFGGRAPLLPGALLAGPRCGAAPLRRAVLLAAVLLPLPLRHGRHLVGLLPVPVALLGLLLLGLSPLVLLATVTLGSAEQSVEETHVVAPSVRSDPVGSVRRSPP